MSVRSSRDLFLPAPLLSAAALGELRSELRMEDTSLKTFVSSPEKVRFTVLDVFTDPQNPYPHNTSDSNPLDIRIEEHRCSSSNAVQVITHANPDARARIISIRANASTAPLNISFPLMSQIFLQYGIEEEFWEILRCFGDSPHPAEGGCTHAFARTYPDGSRSCCYDLQYMDDNQRRGVNVNPWSQRHTGIYHRRMPVEGGRDFDLIIVLHPSLDTRFERSIHSLVTRSENVQSIGGDSGAFTDRFFTRRIRDDPGAIHEVLLETYLSNWRYFLRAKGDEFQDRLDTLFTMDADIKYVDDASLSFEAVQKFRYLRDQILTAAAFCRGNQAVIELLKDVHTRKQPNSHFAASGSAMHERVRGYLSGLDALQTRIDNSIALLEYSLELKHQELAKESNRHMEDLTHSTVDDSATVRTITVLGLVYLPGTFVSGLFGMNFFDFNSDGESGTNYMVIATNFWIYVLLWIAFTGITYGLYWWTDARKKRQAEGGEGSATAEVQRRRRSTAPGIPPPPSMGRLNMRAKGLSSTWRREKGGGTGNGGGTGVSTSVGRGSWRGEKPSLLPMTNSV